MRVAVVGDPYCPSSSMRAALDGLAPGHEVTYANVTEDRAWIPQSASELRLREYLGNPNQLISALDEPDVLVVQGAPVTDQVLDAAPSLRLVCCVRGGPANIDVEAASERGIPVVTTPGKNADAVADLAVAFMVTLARRLPEVFRYIESGGEFGHDNYEGARWFGHDLAGRTLGLIGFGQVGRRVSTRAMAFGMDVAVSDPFVGDAAVQAAGAEAVDLETLLGRADFVSLHARSTRDNHHLIGRAEVARMKMGSYLINTARDVLVNEQAVLAGLESGRLAGAAFDVLSPSPPTGRHRMLAFPNVLISPHIGGATDETLHHGGEMVRAEIQRLANGERLLNVVNRTELDGRTVPLQP